MNAGELQMLLMNLEKFEIKVARINENSKPTKFIFETVSRHDIDIDFSKKEIVIY